MDDLIGEMLHTALFDQAEAVRWRMADIAWHAIDREAVTPAPATELPEASTSLSVTVAPSATVTSWSVLP